MKAIPYEPATPSQDGVLFEQVVTVKRILMTSAVLLVFALMALGVSTAQAAPSGSWYSSFEAARSQSQRQNKPLFVMIARQGCPACAEMQQNLGYSSSRQALSNAVKVRLESSANPRMTARYAGGGTPTTVIFAPGNYQSPIYTYTGAMDPGTISQVGRSLNSM
jgi:hypothetical protein